MPTRWWPSFAVCAFVLAVIAVAVNFDRETMAIGATAPVSFASPSTAAPAGTPVSSAYVGNTKSYKFHRNTCRHAGCTNCTARFATREEAIAAGYRPCGICEP
jgi:hypothetical protein